MILNNVWYFHRYFIDEVQVKFGFLILIQEQTCKKRVGREVLLDTHAYRLSPYRVAYKSFSKLLGKWERSYLIRSRSRTQKPLRQRHSRLLSTSSTTAESGSHPADNGINGVLGPQNGGLGRVKNGMDNKDDPLWRITTETSITAWRPS